MRAVLVGLGAVGARCARQLLSSKTVSELTVLSRRPAEAEARAPALGGKGAAAVLDLRGQASTRAVRSADVVVVACPMRDAAIARVAVSAGVPVVTTSDDPAAARALFELDSPAKSAGVTVVIGAAVAPGLSCLLAAWGASQLDEASEVHVATLGTGGPACARRRHAALREPVEEWRAGAWARRVASSGRELVWFPGEVGADCYRANNPAPFLLVKAMPSLRAATVRAAASRRDRMTSWLPMLRPPHPEGTLGALRVEVRGRRGGAAETLLLGASGRPALVAGAVAACAASRAAAGELLAGAGGLASVVAKPGELLGELAGRGVSLMAFEGARAAPSW
jgi:saccharopine dehydrogenase-like NADP-dependent oxidoreductase